MDSFNEGHLDVVMTGEARDPIRQQVQIETWTVATLRLPLHNKCQEK